MRILFIATRLPWPSRDGGRVLMAATIEGLARLGHDVRVIGPHRGPAPVVPERPAGRMSVVPEVPAGRTTVMTVPIGRPSRAAAVGRAVWSGQPYGITLHRSAAVRAAVARALDETSFDVVHVEQAQALSQAEPAFERGVPVVLRAQNVESDLWRQLSAARPAWRWLAGREATRFARWEARAVRRADAVVALSEADAGRLRELAGPRSTAAVDVVPAPAAPRDRAERRGWEGAPAVAVFSSPWFPNREGVRWFLRDVWPGVLAALPGARLHLFGAPGLPASPGVLAHPAPDDNEALFASDAVLVVPLRLGSGVRIRILDAWARRMPVIATPAAAAGLGVTDGNGVRLAESPQQFASALAELSGSAAAWEALVEQGDRLLRDRHDPDRLARALVGVYERAMARRAAGRAAGSRVTLQPLERSYRVHAPVPVEVTSCVC